MKQSVKKTITYLLTGLLIIMILAVSGFLEIGRAHV